MKIKMHKIIALLMLVFMLVLASQVSAASLTELWTKCRCI